MSFFRDLESRQTDFTLNASLEGLRVLSGRLRLKFSHEGLKVSSDRLKIKVSSEELDRSLFRET